MSKSKFLVLMMACIVLAAILGACSSSITDIQVTQEPLQETSSPPIIRTVKLENCYGTRPREFETSYSQLVQQDISIGTAAKAGSGAEVKISESLKANLTAEISRTYQQKFSTTSAQMDKFHFETSENTISIYEIILKELQAKSTVSYTVKGLFSNKTYSVPYTYTLYVPDMEEGGSKKPTTDCPGGAGEVKAPPALKIEAEGYAEASSHVDTTECSEGGRLLGWINNGEWVSYNHVDFGSGGYKTFRARIASAEQGGEIDIRLDGINGQSIGVCQAPATGDWQNWVTITCNINSDVTGERTIYLLFRGQGEYLYNINWFEFSP